MANFGYTDLALVAPPEWDAEQARGDGHHAHPKSSHRNRKGHPMSIPGWLDKLPDRFGVVDAGLGDVEGHIDSLKVQY